MAYENYRGGCYCIYIKFSAIHKMKRFMLHMVFITMLIIIAFMLTAIWLAYKPVEVYYDVHQPYDILNDNHTVRAGEAVRIRQDYCKNGNDPATVTVVLEDGYYETLRVIESQAPEGCVDGVSHTARIPLDTQEGTYRIRYRIKVQVNPLRTESYELVSEYFSVIE